ncbi:hypothetical protein ANO11243_062970 [Dothideomycetidae sp. 11243]|nr:hypothetical protein ANO11243_062970 [fungal sp. No.11243]
MQSCSTTLFLRAWVMLHLNLPARKNSNITILLRKAKWFTMALLAPELVMLFAAGQWASARRAVRDMKDIGITSWSLEHAFYADAGGLELYTSDYVPFRITAKQVHYLVVRGYIKLPELSKEEICDKSKADRFAKLVAALQSAWFMLQVAARAAEGLSVSLLELSTLCIMTCTAASAFF